MSEGMPVDKIPPAVRRRRNVHLTAAYRSDLQNYYASDLEMRDLELLRQQESATNDTNELRFHELFSGPVSGYRFADWLRIAISRAIPHLCDEYIDTEKQKYTIPFMSRDGKAARIIINYTDYQTDRNHLDSAGEEEVGYICLYKMTDALKTEQLRMSGIFLHQQTRLDPAIGMHINVTGMRFTQTELGNNVPEHQVHLQHGQDLLIVKPYSHEGDLFAHLLQHLDEALEFISQD